MFNADHLGKSKSVGRLITMSALGGVIVAGLMLPAVGSIGLVVKSAATKFTALSFTGIGQEPRPSEILDSQGHLIADIYDVNEPYDYGVKHGVSDIKTVSFRDGIYRQPVSYNQISPNMRRAIVAIEDSRYWLHGAIDFRGTLRAVVNDLEHKPVQGGSTLAQQYVKNVLILTAKNPVNAEAATSDTLSRKLHELRLAIAVEHKESKQDILAGYLNDAYFGYPVIGVETAAETFFHTTAAKLTLAQSAVLAGMVENPSAYNPVTSPTTSQQRRNTVLARMAQLGMISSTTATATEKAPLGLHITQPQNGCTASTASKSNEGFFCDYVMQSLLRDPGLGKTPADRAKLLATGGLKIYTTLSPQDQRAANNAVNFLVPGHNNFYNPGHNADTEAVIQPGTGKIRAIAEDRPYGTGRNQTTIDYAADTPYDGGSGVQSGSSSKLFTLITALEQNVPFGFTQTVPNSFSSIPGYSDCAGGPISWTPGPVNASAGDRGTFSLYTGTTMSINTFYAQLEKKVGLCNVVKTAAALGVHRADGSSLWTYEDKNEYPADQLPSFTLGSVNVSPMTMAAAYATVASRGIYCSPVALQSITTDTGKKLPVPSANCHRAIPAGIADAVSYILQGVLTNGTAAGDGINRPAAGKTGTGNGPYYVDFGGYTPSLVSYSSVFDPTNTYFHAMVGSQACYRSPSGGQDCPGTMFGANAPGQTWQMTFEHAVLGPPTGFVAVPPNSPLFSQGNGQSVRQPKPKGGGGGHGGGGGGGHCQPPIPICPGGKHGHLPPPPASPPPTLPVPAPAKP